MKTIALIRLLFTCSQRLGSRQLGLSPSPDRLTGRRPTSSSPSDSNGPCGHLPGTGRASTALAQIATRKTNYWRAGPRCSHWGRNGFWTFKPVWVSLSPHWGCCCCCCTAIPPPSPMLSSFQDLFESLQVALRRKWIVITDWIHSDTMCLSAIGAVIAEQVFPAPIDVGQQPQKIKTPEAQMRLGCCREKKSRLMILNRGMFLGWCGTSAITRRTWQSTLQEHPVR